MKYAFLVDSFDDFRKGQKRPKSSPALASSSKSSKNGQGSYVYVAKKPALKPDSDSSDEDNVSDESLDSD